MDRFKNREMSTNNQNQMASEKPVFKGIVYSGTILEVGPPTSSFSGTKVSYIRLKLADGTESNVPGMVVLPALAPYIRPNAQMNLYVERCSLTNIMIRVQAPTAKIVSDLRQHSLRCRNSNSLPWCMCYLHHRRGCHQI